MPNPGGVYLGCEACRRRKVKCDQTYPSCTRCLARGKPCPGVLRRSDAMIRDETARFTNKANNSTRTTNPYVPSHHMQHVFRHEKTSPSAVPETVLQEPTPGVVDMLDITRNTLRGYRTDEALASFFFNKILIPVGWFSFLPNFFSMSPDHGGFKKTLFSTALFVLANQTRDPDLMNRAWHCYGSALISLNQALGNEQLRLSDEVLYTILMFNVIDDIVGHRHLTSCSHLQGCKRLLELREFAGFKRSEYEWEVQHSIVIQAQLFLLEDFSKSASLVAGNTWRSRVSGTPAGEMLVLCANIGLLRQRYRESKPSSQDALLNFLAEGKEIESQLLNWTHRLEPWWQRHTSIIESADGQYTTVDYYSNIQISKVWNQYRCGHQLLLETMIKAALELGKLEHCEQTFKGYLRRLVQSSQEQVESLMDGICDSIFFHLQRIDQEGRLCEGNSNGVIGATALIWPLKMVLSCESSNEQQTCRARKALWEIGDDIGIREATLFVQNN